MRGGSGAATQYPASELGVRILFLLQKRTDEDLRAREGRKNLHKQFGLFSVQFALGEQTNSSEGQEKKNNLIWEQHLPSVFYRFFSLHHTDFLDGDFNLTGELTCGEVSLDRG